MNSQNTSLKLGIRNPTPEDAQYINRYWAETTQDDLDRMGETERPSPQGNIDFLKAYCSNPLPPEKSEEELVIWTADGAPIGYSTLKSIRYGKDAQIHLHLWEKKLRGRGLGGILFCLSAKKFIADFKLQTLFCQPKHDNSFPNGLFRRLGFERLGQVEWENPRTGHKVRQNQYRIDSPRLQRHLNWAGLHYDLE